VVSPAQTEFGPKVGLAADALAVRPGKTRHKDRPRSRPRQIEFTQKALWVLFRETGAPYGMRRGDLVEAVNNQLKKDPEWCAAGFSPVSYKTIERAMELVWPI